MHPAGCATYLTHLVGSSLEHERDLLAHVQERIEFAEGLQQIEAYMGYTPPAHAHAHAACTRHVHIHMHT